MLRLLLAMLVGLALPLVGFTAEKKELEKPIDGTVPLEASTVSVSDAEVLEAMGASISTELGKFGFSDAEVEFFLKGFRRGLKGEINREDLNKMDSRIQAFIRPRMEAAQVRERERDKARMADLRLPMDMEIANSGGEKTTLGKLVKGKNGVLLDFWASWCGPCMALMPELQKKAKRYGSRGIVVAGMNTENTDKAEGVRRNRGIEFTWLVEVF